MYPCAKLGHNNDFKDFLLREVTCKWLQLYRHKNTCKFVVTFLRRYWRGSQFYNKSIGYFNL